MSKVTDFEELETLDGTEIFYVVKDGVASVENTATTKTTTKGRAVNSVVNTNATCKVNITAIDI